MVKKTIITLYIVLGIIILGVIICFPWLKKIYISNAASSIGYIINIFILLVFISGIIKIFFELKKYLNEEKAIYKFMLNYKNNVEDKLFGVDRESLISERYNLIKKLFNEGITPDIKILSGFLLLNEENKKTYLKYINNILILTGVFGTVISLIISLLGASNFIKLTDEKSMSTIIFGMSTALNTTFTAILCFFIFNYFLLKLNQVQKNIALQIEKLTYFNILPDFHTTKEKIIINIDKQLDEIKNVIVKFNETQEALREYAFRFSKLINLNYETYKKLDANMINIQEILKEGFRLK